MSPENDILRQRLEERITHCEHLADTLNSVLTDLQQRMLALERQNRKLVEAVQQQQAAARGTILADEKPPHY